MPAPKLLKKLRQKLPWSRRSRISPVAGAAPTTLAHSVSPAQSNTAAIVDPSLVGVTPAASSHFVSPAQGDIANVVDPPEKSTITTSKSISRKFLGPLRFALTALQKVSEDTGVPGLKAVAGVLVMVLDNVDVSPFSYWNY